MGGSLQKMVCVCEIIQGITYTNDFTNLRSANNEFLNNLLKSPVKPDEVELVETSAVPCSN